MCQIWCSQLLSSTSSCNPKKHFQFIWISPIDVNHRWQLASLPAYFPFLACFAGSCWLLPISINKPTLSSRIILKRWLLFNKLLIWIFVCQELPPAAIRTHRHLLPVWATTMISSSEYIFYSYFFIFSKQFFALRFHQALLSDRRMMGPFQDFMVRVTRQTKWYSIRRWIMRVWSGRSESRRARLLNWITAKVLMHT